MLISETPAMIPVTAFALGTWQIQRLKWKTDLIAKCEDRLVRPPLPLPPRIDASAIADFDYRRVYANGTFRHDQEMLIGPRMRDGEQGYMVVTPLERGGGEGTAVLVNRGWISKKHAAQSSRPDSLPKGEVRVEGLLREPWKKNMFTPENRPDKGEFYFPDVEQMARLTGAQPVWVEQTMGRLLPFRAWLIYLQKLESIGHELTSDNQTLTCYKSMTMRVEESQSDALQRSICAITMLSTSSHGESSLPLEAPQWIG
jgi:cytochrome oxidase assembly protein ShyY1